MSISFSCQCGKQIQVAEKFAGRRAKCPGCGQPVAIPQPGAPDEDIDGDLLFEALGGGGGAQPQTPPVPCPECNQVMPATASVCTFCGYRKNAQTYNQAATASSGQPAKKGKKQKREPGESRLPTFNFSSGAVKVLVVLALFVGGIVWYYLGPARNLHINEVITVSMLEPVPRGDRHPPFTEEAMLSTFSRGGKKQEPSLNPDEEKAADDIYAIGSGEKLFVTRPDDMGDYVILHVALKQDTIKNMSRTHLYDSIISGKDFHLVPEGGGTPIEGRLLHGGFGDSIEIDTGMANTTSYSALFPVEPTQIEEEKDGGVIQGKAYWSEPLANGEISFTSYYSYGEFTAPKGVYGEGRLKLSNVHGLSVDMDYDHSTLEVDWDRDATGWWSRRDYRYVTHTNPWHRYELTLLFKRPANGGLCELTYCDKPVATFRLYPTPELRTPAASPIKGSSPTSQTPTNNPLEYFSLMAEARDKARGIVSASNLSQLGQAMYMYLDQNNQKWPDRISQLESVMPNYQQVMVNPRTGANPGFIYIKPDPGADPRTTGVIFESLHAKPDPNGAVLYADGHIE